MTEEIFAYFYGVPRSGSTLVRRVLHMLFAGENIPSDHSWVKTTKPLVVTYRDFRDIAVSYWRTSWGKYDEYGNLTNKIDTQYFLRQCAHISYSLANTLNECKIYYSGKGNVLYLQYEKFYNNYEYLFGQLEKFFNIEITKELKEQIIKNTNIDYHRKIAENVKILNPNDFFASFDQQTGIHPHHIHTGKVGTWKELVIPQYHKFFTMLLRNDLQEWGYKI